jgi:hypothetical protein
MDRSQSSPETPHPAADGTGDEKSTAASPSPPLSAAAASKVTQIVQACRNDDLDALIALAASSNGLMEDKLRRTACMASST